MSNSDGYLLKRNPEWRLAVLEDEKIFPSCCSDFSRAREDGTDSEGEGPAISHMAFVQWRIGFHPTVIKFCPWCGKSLADRIKICAEQLRIFFDNLEEKEKQK